MFNPLCSVFMHTFWHNICDIYSAHRLEEKENSLKKKKKKFCACGSAVQPRLEILPVLVKWFTAFPMQSLHLCRTGHVPSLHGERLHFKLKDILNPAECSVVKFGCETVSKTSKKDYLLDAI